MTEQRDIKRRAPRYELQEDDLHGRTRHNSYIHLVDLSTRGALLECHRYIKPNAALDLQILLGGVHLKIRATVVHCTPHDPKAGPSESERSVYRVGVRFEELDDSDEKTIEDLIRQRVSDERREQPRLLIGRPAQIEEDIELRAINLGPKGGLFSVRYPLEFNGEHNFVFSLPTGVEVKAHGVVRHCQAWIHAHGEPRFQVGLEFTDYHSDGEARVRDYLATLEDKHRLKAGR